MSNGVNGTLRADYNGQPISISDPTVQRFFNTDAFSVPPPGLFGTAARNTIIGPGYHNVNMALSKNFNFSGSRGMTVRVQASNIFNNVEFSTIDTVVNSPTFGAGDRRAPDALDSADCPFEVLTRVDAAIAPCRRPGADDDRRAGAGRGARRAAVRSSAARPSAPASR